MLGQALGPMALSSTLDMDLTCVFLTATQEDPLSTVATIIAGTFQLISWCAAVFTEVPSVDVFENTTDDDDEALEDDATK